MIRNCEDVKTMNDFHDCCRLCNKLFDMGLIETSRMIRWREKQVINPALLSSL